VAAPLNIVDLLAIFPYFLSFAVDQLKVGIFVDSLVMMLLSPQDTMVIGRAGKVLRLIKVMRIMRVFKVTSKICEHSKNCVRVACATFHWPTEPPLHNAAGIPGAGASHGPPLGHRHHHLQVQQIISKFLIDWPDI
jgi:hypothetical protein